MINPLTCHMITSDLLNTKTFKRCMPLNQTHSPNVMHMDQWRPPPHLLHLLTRHMTTSDLLNMKTFRRCVLLMVYQMNGQPNTFTQCPAYGPVVTPSTPPPPPHMSHDLQPPVYEDIQELRATNCNDGGLPDEPNMVVQCATTLKTSTPQSVN